jgi:hypothetical protein
MQDFDPDYDRSGSNPVKLRTSKCRLVCPRQPTFLGAVGTAEKCHKRAAAHARAQAARAQKSIETVSQTERCNITGGEPAAALALRT